ncbi:patatin-like phospholipase RssA [Leptospira sp. GIMC2001]|uniref:patatin-like phospholipase RssA n=1 Tax=Leptospira sp. GIMC2001 TaxID=1513297 RepID=UPI00234A2E7B|nr:patatin-like phospholipase RssA [Leptospira sp. GIMC2001]WCL50056.1 patatin-like phospholipase RssA [Leptospira sp. GIMC2001]
MRSKKSIIGLALGSGSARGWSHIGVIRALEERGIVPDVICGTSVGSIVAAAYASDQLDDLEAWVTTLEWKDVVGFMDLNLRGGGGLFKGKKLFDYMRERFGEWDINALNKKFGSVATDVDTGLEVWLRDGKLLSAVRASISLPAIFTPVLRDGRWLVDGGLVNPVPVSLCRAMGANYIIAIDLNSDLLDVTPPPDLIDEKKSAPLDRLPGHPEKETKDKEPSFWTATKERITTSFWGKDLKDSLDKEKDERPSMIEVISKSINIMQVRITRSRMAGDPPDVLITPKLGYMGLMEFHRAQEAIDEGKAAVARAERSLM